MAPAEVPAAVLPGTPSTFSIPADKLIALAQKVSEANSGVDDPDLLADNFRFEFPVVSLAKKDYVKAVSGFKLKEAFPNMNSHPYDWRVDKYEPNRVWWTVRNTATHTGPLKFFGATYKPTGKVVLGAPECLSYTFNEEGKVTSFTGGYIMDRRVGNTNKLGAMFGILSAIGAPVPSPGSPMFFVRLATNAVRSFISGVFEFIFGSGEKKK
ncbi:hypothetical protein WJX75_005112 [Coccomyxa subellipsoidea]|uniref:Uncharacterized protein n=1 Tax=Coccomyxa subellipsoidea TaxID=248742 RepID=A0ABR2YGF4_9CHLO